MGTRNLTCVFKDGEYKVAQYCQWDGYPSGQGLTALNFLRIMERQTFEQKLSRVHFADDKEIQNLWVECGADPKSDGVNLDVSNVFKKKYLHLHRDCGADILTLIHDFNGESMPLHNSLDFAYSSLFCEWCYVIDLDKNTFEVFKGFNKRKPGKNARFNDIATTNLKGEYFTVRLKKKYALDALPTDKEFLKQCGDEV